MNAKRLFYLATGLGITIVSIGLVLIATATSMPANTSVYAAAAPLPPDKALLHTTMADDPSPPTSPVKLIFIHHSTGENWLTDGDGNLGIALRDNNYFVSDTNYGWGPSDADLGYANIGDHTDIGHWYNWFAGPNYVTYTTALYTEYDQNSVYSRLATDPGGENEIIMFKSCYPNSHISGNPTDPPTTGANPLRGQDAWSEYMTVGNVKGIYNDILGYFATRTDKLFVLIVSPPLIETETDATHAANARAIAEWLVNDWLDGYPHDNVAVFDFYNVLTSNGGNTNINDLDWPTGNHHRWLTGTVQHTQTVDNNFSAYGGGNGGGSHPTAAGGQKASGEFVPLLNVFYNRWKSGSSACEPITDAGITGPTYGYTDTLTSFTAVITPASASVPITYTWVPAPSVGVGENVSYTWPTTGEKTITVTAENCGGSDTAVHAITILPSLPGCPFPVLDVTITGPSGGYTDTTYTFEAIATSAGDDPTPPITYTWSPTPAGSTILPGQAVVTYTWPTTGTKTITVTAENCGGDSRDVVTHTITIRTRGQYNVYLPLVLRNYGSTPSSGGLIQPDDLTYLGAFRLPDRAAGAPDEESWEYSGQALTYRPDGDPGNTDGHPGSLFGTGHDVYNYVSEISIPVPSTSRDLEQLNVATTLQGFNDVRGGLFDGLTEMPRVGMQYLPAQAGQTSAKLHLAWGAHHHDEGSSTDTPSHAWCDLDLSVPNTQGAWWIGDAPLYRVNGYIFEIPQEWADTYAGGARLATGRYRDGGWSGMGPNIFAYGPWLDGSPPISGTHLTAHTVLSYSFSGGAYALTNYHDSDEWEGGAWLTEGARSAVVLVGTKGGGDYWWYGYSSPGGDGMPCPFIPPPGSEDEVRCYNSDGTDCAEGLLDCEGYELESKGWWSSRFDAQIMFYDPADFSAILNDTMEPYEPQPYATLDIDENLFMNAPAEVETDCGTGDQRKCRIGEVAYDRERGFLYVLERFADDSKPVIHVWRVD